MAAADRAPGPDRGAEGSRQALRRGRARRQRQGRRAGRRLSSTTPEQIVHAAFVQLELAGSIGLAEGRYLVREEGDERVLIVTEHGAPRAGRRRGGRRARSVDSGEERPVPVTLATVTGERLGDAAAGSAWLESVLRDRQRAAEEVRRGVRIINRALNAWRAGGHDPLVTEVGASKALAVRLGHGAGQQLAEGRWTEAKEIPRPRAGRLEGMDPQSRVAGVLAGRDEVHPAETLMLRARLDAELGRLGEARYGLRAARAAFEEDPPERPKELRQELERIERKLSGRDEPLAD